MKTTSVLAFFLIAATIPCFGQANACSPVGTWFGGSDMTHPYQLSVAPIGGNRYSVRFQQGVDYPSFGILGWTEWSGEMTKRPGQKYELAAAAIFVVAPEAQLAANPDMDVIHSTIEFSPNCNTIRHTIDTFGGYIPWTEEKVPFVTPLDFDYIALFLNGQPLVEEYHRMPTDCAICPKADHEHHN